MRTDLPLPGQVGGLVLQGPSGMTEGVHTAVQLRSDACVWHGAFRTEGALHLQMEQADHRFLSVQVANGKNPGYDIRICTLVPVIPNCVLQLAYICMG